MSIIKVNNEDNLKLIAHIPKRYLTESRIKNFSLSRLEEGDQKIHLQSMPYHYVIEPNNSCNLKCPLCPTGLRMPGRKGGKLDFSNFKKLIDQISDFAIELYMQNWGESTLMPDLPEMIAYASSKNIWTHLSTNFSIPYKPGYLERLMRSGLSYIHIDVDGATQDTYEKYRKGGDVNLVLKNLEEIVGIKSKLNLNEPIIEAEMLVMSHNEHEIELVEKILRGIGVDKIKQGKIQVNPSLSKDWLPLNSDHVYKTYQDKVSIDKDPCHWPWSGMVINWNGGVSACCIVDDSSADFGNALEVGIAEIWNNNNYQAARSEFSKEKFNGERNTICNECKNDTHNLSLRRIGSSFAIMKSV